MTDSVRPTTIGGPEALRAITGDTFYEIRFHRGQVLGHYLPDPGVQSTVLGTCPTYTADTLRSWIATAFKLNILPSPIAYTDELRAQRVENDSEGKLKRRVTVAVWRPAWVECETEGESPLIEVVQ